MVKSRMEGGQKEKIRTTLIFKIRVKVGVWMWWKKAQERSDLGLSGVRNPAIRKGFVRASESRPYASLKKTPVFSHGGTVKGIKKHHRRASTSKASTSKKKCRNKQSWSEKGSQKKEKKREGFKSKNPGTKDKIKVYGKNPKRGGEKNGSIKVNNN